MQRRIPAARHLIALLRTSAAHLIVVGLLIVWPTAVQAEDQRPPNIVMIMADDLGYECIGANGGTSYATPVLDKMALRGMRFRHCYSQPLCTPSRVKLMTGLSNIRNYVQFGVLERTQRTFAQQLKQAGYATCIVGKWQLGLDVDLPQRFGFDESCLWQHYRLPSRYASAGLEVNGQPRDYPGRYGPDVVTEYALDFIKRQRDRPFLLYYPMILTHCPFEPTPDSADWDPNSPGSATYKGDPKYFGDMVCYMDKLVGRLLQGLKQAGVRERTLVIFTGDNGTDKPVVSQMGDRQVAGAKGAMHDGGTRVPLIIEWPGHTPAGKVSDDLIDFSDFFPTFCDLAGADSPTALDGHSFAPQILGQAGTPREWIHIWYSREGGPRGAQFTRNQRYKLYRTGNFYDVANDPLERQPLTQLDASQQSARTMLQAALDEFADARPAKFANWKPINRKAKKPKKSKKAKKRGKP